MKGREYDAIVRSIVRAYPGIIGDMPYEDGVVSICTPLAVLDIKISLYSVMNYISFYLENICTYSIYTTNFQGRTEIFC